MKLADDLAKRNMELRVNNILYRHVKTALSDCGIEFSPPFVEPRKRARCYKCPRKEGKTSQVSCDTCKKLVCEAHRRKTTKVLCFNCAVKEKSTLAYLYFRYYCNDCLI